MRPRWLLPLLGYAWLCAGCESERSHTFAVTLLDSSTIDCYGYAQDLLADPAALDDAATDEQKAWKERFLVVPPKPLARVLRINELERRMQAWFDPAADDATAPVPATDGGLDDADGGAPVDKANEELPYLYDDAGIVYEGELHDDYIEGVYRDQINTDETDEEQGLRLCGTRTLAKGTLTLTTAGGALGRIRWVHTTYVASEYSACAGRIECARDIAIEGLEAQ